MTKSIDAFFPLKRGRAHEVSGASSYGFSFALGARIGEDLLWLREDWLPETLNPHGFSQYLDPGRVLIAKAQNQIELLGAAEEALRSGAVKLVVLELSKPLDFTPARRLNLAAETGKSTALCILPEGMGSNASETRWYCSPVFHETKGAAQRWSLTKNKAGPTGSWVVRWDQNNHRLEVLSSSVE